MVVQAHCGAGGKVLTISGFYFDVQETRHALHNVEEVKTLMERANREYKALQGKLRNAVRVFQHFQHDITVRAEPIRRKIEDKERERNDLIQQYSYALMTPIAWRIVDDYSRFAR